MEDEKLDTEDLNEELLQSTVPQEKSPKNVPIQRKLSGKAYIIDKINNICSKTDLICPHSPTALKRMKKADLEQVLADLVEQGIQREIEKKLKFERRDDETPQQTSDRMALSALKLVHNTCTRLVETGVKNFTPYQIDGFTESLQHPETQEQLDECLLEICKEREILEMLNCPYTKLAIIWGGGIMMNLRKKRITNNNVGVFKKLEPRNLKKV